MLKQLSVSLLLVLIVAFIAHGWWLSDDASSSSSQPFVASIFSEVDDLVQAERLSQRLDKEREACQFVASARDQQQRVAPEA
jgi:hypothetical protein